MVYLTSPRAVGGIGGGGGVCSGGDGEAGLCFGGLDTAELGVDVVVSIVTVYAGGGG